MLRRLTDIQFSEGCAIVGERLERAMRAGLAHFNLIPKRDLARRFVQTQVTAGYLPDPQLNVHLPFQRQTNADAYATGPPYPDAYLNPERWKGIYQAEDLVKYGWQTALAVHKPVIVDAIHVVFQTDTDYINSFAYGGSAPPGKNTGDPVDDIDVLITVDNPFATENDEQNSVVLARHAWEVEGDKVTFSPLGAYTDMAPVHPGGDLQGLYIEMTDLNIPIPRDSVCRCTLTVPVWASTFAPWGAAPWATIIPGFTITLLEELEQ